MQSHEPAPLIIKSESLGTTAIVRLSGAATIDQSDRLSRELRGIAGQPFSRIVMDLSGLNFICSMGLGALIVAHVACRRRNAQVVLVAPQPAVREILETTRLNMIFPIYSDVASAGQ